MMEIEIKPKFARVFSLSRRKSVYKRKHGISAMPQSKESELNNCYKENVTSPSMVKSSSLDRLSKRKETCSPNLPKKKPFRKISLPFFAGTKHCNKCNQTQVSNCEILSTFESELSDQENHSPNDPEFVRRASYRWKQKNEISQKDNSSNRICVRDYMNEEFSQESPSIFKQSSNAEKSNADLHKQNVEYCPNTSLVSMSSLSSNRSFNSSNKQRLSIRTQKSLTYSKPMDDCTTKLSSNTISSLLNRFNNVQQVSVDTFKKRRSHSFSGGHRSLSSTFNISMRKNNKSAAAHGDLKSSKSYHCELSSYFSDISSQQSVSRLGFDNALVNESSIVDDFAIMFPSEPRPEWHRHLRQVLHKAGQKIFKKPEHHDTTIPENLRYQLKQIYVY